MKVKILLIAVGMLGAAGFAAADEWNVKVNFADIKKAASQISSKATLAARSAVQESMVIKIGDDVITQAESYQCTVLNLFVNSGKLELNGTVLLFSDQGTADSHICTVSDAYSDGTVRLLCHIGWSQVQVTANVKNLLMSTDVVTLPVDPAKAVVKAELMCHVGWSEYHLIYDARDFSKTLFPGRKK